MFTLLNYQAEQVMMSTTTMFSEEEGVKMVTSIETN